MSVLSTDNRLGEFKASKRGFQLQSLRTQIKLYGTLRFRHLYWADDAEDKEAAHIHADIARLNQEVSEKINDLLELYKRHGP